MDKRKLLIALGALLLVVAAVFGLSLTRQKDAPEAETKMEAVEARSEALKEACASNATYARLKEVVFEEAVRIRNADPANLDTLAANAVVRMENPVVKSRDENLNVTVCSGRFVLELPPGAERGFGGERRLTADIEYAAQAALDGSGLVYQMNGAEPIIYRLAAFDLQRQREQPREAPPESQYADADEPAGTVDDAPAPAPQIEQEANLQPAPEQRAPAATAARVRPSFNCAAARTRSERMVCSSPGLAARDRAMSSLFYSALANADARQRQALRSTRDRFLAYRERCGSEACVADAYEGRMMEIRDIMAD